MGSCEKDDTELSNAEERDFELLNEYSGTPKYVTAGDDFFCFYVLNKSLNDQLSGPLGFRQQFR